MFLKFYFPSLTRLMEILSTIEQDRPLQEPNGNVCCWSEDNLLGHVFAGRCSWKPCFPSFSWRKSRHSTSTTSPFPSHPLKEGNEFGFGTMCSWRIHSGFFNHFIVLLVFINRLFNNLCQSLSRLTVLWFPRFSFSTFKKERYSVYLPGMQCKWFHAKKQQNDIAYDNYSESSWGLIRNNGSNWTWTFREITRQEGEAVQVELSHLCRGCVAAAGAEESQAVVAWSGEAAEGKAPVRQELHTLEYRWYPNIWVFGSWYFSILEAQCWLGAQLSISQCGKAKLSFSSMHWWPEKTERPTYDM